MKKHRFTCDGRRSAFTLVELLVVIFIILTLAAIVVSMTPRFAGTRKLTQGAEQLQGYLLTAKQRARRDQLATGVRLTTATDNPNLVRLVQFIQQPDVFSQGTISYTPGAQKVIVQGQGVDFTGGNPPVKGQVDPNLMALWPVQPGDFLEIKGGGLVHRIVQVIPNALQLQSAPPNQVFSTSEYRIIRQPRILTGETPLELPQDIVIDVTPSTGPPQFSQGLVAQGNNQGQVYYDILFAPSGAVLAQGNKTAVILWVRDTTVDISPPNHVEGEPILLTVYTRTGLIAAHPVSYNVNDPYEYTKDGHSSGL